MPSAIWSKAKPGGTAEQAADAVDDDADRVGDVGRCRAGDERARRRTQRTAATRRRRAMPAVTCLRRGHRARSEVGEPVERARRAAALVAGASESSSDRGRAWRDRLAPDPPVAPLPDQLHDRGRPARLRRGDAVSGQDADVPDRDPGPVLVVRLDPPGDRCSGGTRSARCPTTSTSRAASSCDQVTAHELVGRRGRAQLAQRLLGRERIHVEERLAGAHERRRGGDGTRLGPREARRALPLGTTGGPGAVVAASARAARPGRGGRLRLRGHHPIGRRRATARPDTNAADQQRPEPPGARRRGPFTTPPRRAC